MDYKRITEKQLLEDLAKIYNKLYDIDYVDYRDMWDYLTNANEDYIEEKDLYYCTIELCRVGKVPEIYRFYTKYICDNNDNIIDIQYFEY